MRRRLFLLWVFAIIATQFFARAQAQTYTTSGHQILSNGNPWCAGGVNAFDQYGPTNTSGHEIKVVREVVNNFSGCILGNGSQSWNGSVLHGLQDVVNNNRAQGEITILCVFSWDSSGAITGGDPSNSSNYPWFSSGQYASRLAALATQFKGQSDVWIDPWNEPNFSSQSDWNSCVTTMYNAIRNAGNTNIILIPSNNWDSDESSYTNGTGWLSGKSNVVGTIHIYSGWDWDSEANIQSRLQNLLNAGWPLIVGEIGPDSYQSDPIRGIQATIAVHVPTLAWSWDSSDGDQLQNGGTLTNWGNEWFSNIGKYISTIGPVGHLIALYNPSAGHYASCNLNGSDTIMAQWANSVGGWETFKVYAAGSGYIALYSPASNYYVSVNNGWSKNLQAAWATSIGATEEFKWQPQSNGSVALQGTDGWYVSANLNNNDILTTSLANGYVGNWEQFTWTDLGTF